MVLNDENIEEKLSWIRNGGVTTMWLYGYFFGHDDAPLEDMAKAKEKLEQQGFEVQIISLPVGHPGNSLDPTNPDLDLSIPDTWTYRVDRKGDNVYYCACINEVLISDNKKAMERYKSLGITKVFFDDDLRMGNWGNEIEGCFCDKCIENFNSIIGENLTRDDLSEICLGVDLDEQQAGIQNEWIKFNCNKITKFLTQTQTEGIQSGIMIMHNGDEKHGGISIVDILHAIPDCMIRVGEFHFDDTSYDSDEGRKSVELSILNHMKPVKNKDLIYSESTVFPANALSPENLIDKIKLEIRCGIRNIFLMGGSWFIERRYWDLLRESMKELNDLTK